MYTHSNLSLHTSPRKEHWHAIQGLKNGCQLSITCSGFASVHLLMSLHFFNQSEAILKPMVTHKHTLSRASLRLHGFSSRCDWLRGLSVPNVISQCYYNPLFPSSRIRNTVSYFSSGNLNLSPVNMNNLATTLLE